MVKKNISTNKKVVTIGTTALLVTGVGGYGIGVATHQYVGDSPEDYAITSSERDSALKTLSSLTTKSSSMTIPEYNRDAVFSGWKDLDGNGCPTRFDVLTNNFRKYARYDTESCIIKSGTLFDYYNGNILKYYKTDKQTDGGIQIDHIVSLGDAWISGGYNWKDSQGNLDAQKWTEYANDTDNLLPTASSTNESKGSKNIVDWQPANTNFLCTYAIKQIQIKNRYKLTVTSEEKAKLQSVLKENCIIQDN